MYRSRQKKRIDNQRPRKRYDYNVGVLAGLCPSVVISNLLATTHNGLSFPGGVHMQALLYIRTV